MGDFHGETTGLLENKYLQLEYLTTAPRIVRLAPAGKPNMFADMGRTPIATPYGDFYFRGGHRLWHSPEAMPRTYIPDNESAVVSAIEQGVRIDQPVEAWTQIAKRLEIRLDPKQARLVIRHELRNAGAWTAELAVWALTMFRPGGVAIFPQPAGNVDAAGLLPNRQITLWPYASVNDPRLGLADDFVLVRADPRLPPFKLGYFNRHGWMGYWLDGVLFVKRFEARSDASLHPDGGCNVESYCNDQFIELETLSPLTKLAPGETVTHEETWELYDSLVQEFIPDSLRQRLK
jgi:hypothetical protein